jgi:leucyl aminopeptidase
MGSPGSITAALFLRPFAAGVPWAHLDLAGVGDATKDADVWTEGPTGFGARALLTWLTAPEPLAGVRPARR